MSTSAPPKITASAIHSIIPILSVANLEASLDFYLRILGFTKDWDWADDNAKPTFASVSHDGCHIMLCQEGQGHAGTWLWVGVHDAQSLFETFKAAGAKVLQPPTNYSWALEFRLEDPDGHVLRFGSETLEDQPVAR